MDLALGRTRADRAPRHEIRDVLRRDRVEELACRRHPAVEDLEHEVAGLAEARVHVPGLVEVGVVDHALPAGGRSGLLEVHAHHAAELVAQLGRLLVEALRVVERGLDVVDAARSHDDHQPVVGLVEDPLDLLAAREDPLHVVVRHRELGKQPLRRREGLAADDAEVPDRGESLRGTGWHGLKTFRNSGSKSYSWYFGCP